jgi:glycine cleavage system T protein (aminomethyltransferase)
MVEYAGYEMPVQYEGVLAEHAVVREKVGLFDITHMGEIYVTGPGSRDWISGLITNSLKKSEPGKVVYNAMCKEDGGVLDDMLVYCLAEERWLVVCNAANHDKIVAWLNAQLPTDPAAAPVFLDDQSDQVAMIAVQGPVSLELVQRLQTLAGRSDDIRNLDFYTAFTHDGPGGEWLVSRTGYTGEHGYELYLPNSDALAVWEELLAKGKDLGVAPIGLAARDTLRFEVCYCLYGHELGEDISPLEAGIGWAVKLKKKGGFIGRDAIASQKENGVPRQIVCLEMDGKGIARQDARVLANGKDVGYVTSGTFSPTLKKALALALVEKELPDGDLAVDVRGRHIPCHTVAFPFLSARTKDDPLAERSPS